MNKIKNFIAWVIVALVFTATSAIAAEDAKTEYTVGEKVHHSIVCLDKEMFDVITEMLKTSMTEASAMMASRAAKCYYAPSFGKQAWTSTIKEIGEKITDSEGDCARVLTVTDGTNTGWMWAKCRS